MRLSPQDPQMFGMQVAIALAHFFAGRYEEALSWAQSGGARAIEFLRWGLCVAAASAALGRKAREAREAMARVRQLNPALRLVQSRRATAVQPPEDLDRWAEGLRRAGLPE